MSELKTGVSVIGVILSLFVFTGNAVAEEGARLSNATSVYHEILASLNEHNEIGSAQIPTLSEKIVPASPIKPTLSIEEETRQFVEEIRFEIQEFVAFPDSLKGKGYQATVLVEFGLNADGTIRDLKVNAKEGAALALFEARALLAVQKASRFFPLVPEQVDVSTLTFRIPIIFEEA